MYEELPISKVDINAQKGSLIQGKNAKCPTIDVLETELLFKFQWKRGTIAQRLVIVRYPDQHGWGLQRLAVQSACLSLIVNILWTDFSLTSCCVGPL